MNDVARKDNSGAQGRRRRRRPRKKPTEASSVSERTGGANPKRSKEGSRKSNGSTGSPREGSRSGASSRGGGRGGKNSRRGGRNQRRQARDRNQRNASRRRNDAAAQSHVSIETSAGGLVVSGLAEAVAADGTVDLSRIYVALIGRLDRRGRLLWSMPKGHVESDEAFDSTAEREVWEETGVHGRVIKELGVIDYWFISEGKRIHKTVHHFLLRFVDGDLNDEDPEVTEVTWVPVDSLVERLAYADERKLARRAHNLLPDLARAEKQAGRPTPR